MDLTVREVLDRYGPSLALVAVLALLVALLPGNSDDRTSGPVGQQIADASAGVPGASDATAPAGDQAAGLPAVAASGSGVAAGSRNAGPGGAGGAGGSSAAGITATCPGQLAGFSGYDSPCVPVFQGDNGGATSQGVTRDQILVVRYKSQNTAAVDAALNVAGAQDTAAQIDFNDETYRRYFNLHYETYGREIVVKTKDGTGDPADDNVMRSDAIDIATRLKPFAVVVGAPHAVTAIFIEELAARGVVCICGTVATRAIYGRMKGFMWPNNTDYPTADLQFIETAEYIGKRLANRAAQWAGDLPVGIKTSPRKFGFIAETLVNGRTSSDAQTIVDLFHQELAKYGVKITKEVQIAADISRYQEQAVNVISQMKAAGVTTMICLCTLFAPVSFTREATNQQYFPEWLINGTFYADTTFWGRLYDQAQWRHAFGFTPLSVIVGNRRGWEIGEWKHMNPSRPESDAGVAHTLREVLFRILATGINGAGPRLTPQTFAAGMYAYPLTGGAIHHPAWQFTAADPSQPKDIAEVWYDPARQGEDEVGKGGVGMIVFSNGGKRLRAGEIPAGSPNAFDPTGAVTKQDIQGSFVRQHQDSHPVSARCRSCT